MEDKSVTVEARFCHPYMNFGGDGCNAVNLIFEPPEVEKLVSVVHMSNTGGQVFEYSPYPEYFKQAFLLVITFFLVGFAIGRIINVLKAV